MENIKEELIQIAKQHLLSEIRFINADELEPKVVFSGRQPKNLMPEAKSLIISSVYIGGFYLPDVDLDHHGRISRLTLSGFYFNVVNPLKPLQDHLNAKGYKAAIYDGLLEDNCIPLKQAAVKAGLGWIGKNTLLMNQKYGSFQALGGIVTNADLGETYALEKDHCGNCTACLDACPAKAIEPRRLERSRCLSNLLEEDGIPESVTEMPGGFFFECDLCQEACPWNRKHLKEPIQTGIEKTFTNKDGLTELFAFESLLHMDERAYREKILPLFTGVPLSYELFRRNVNLAYRYKHKEQVTR